METDPPRPMPRLWPVLALCAALALWIDLGSYHHFNNSDSLLPVLVSLYRWTPFYWDQNRVGMLTPLLALPIANPFHNLLFQAWLVLWAALAVPFLLARWVLRNPAWPLAGALGVAAQILVFSSWWFFNSSFGQLHYPVSMALGLGALLCVEAAAPGPSLSWRRLVAALTLMLLATWACSGVGPLLLALVVIRTLLRWMLDRETLLALGVTAAGLASCFGHRLLVPAVADPVSEGLLPVGRWPEAWAEMAAGTWQEAGRPGSQWLLVLAIVAAVSVVLAVRQRQARGLLAAALAPALAGVAYGLFAGTTRWAEVNLFSARYWIPTAIFLLSALAVLAVAPLVRRSTPRLRAVAVLALVPLIAIVHGIPSRARARAEVDRITPEGACLVRRTEEVLRGRATHLVGNYWQLWASVFHANLVLYERGDAGKVWGVGCRSGPTWNLWRHAAPEDLRVALLTDGGRPDPSADVILRCCLPPLEVVARHKTCWELRARETVLLARPPASAAEPVVASLYGDFYPGLEFQDVIFRGGGPCGKLNLTNPSDRPQTVTLRLKLASATLGNCRLWIEGPLWCDECTLSPSPKEYVRTVVVPPGRHVVQFCCSGAAHPSSSPGLPLLYLTSEFQLIQGTAP
jgi:hypothetical protein